MIACADSSNGYESSRSPALPSSASVITTDNAIVQFLNYTNFSTDMIFDYLNLAESNIALEEYAVFGFIYPVGKFIKEGGDFNGKPFNTHEVVLSEDKLTRYLLR